MIHKSKKKSIKTKCKLSNLIINNFSIGWITPFVLSKLEKDKKLFKKVDNYIEIIPNKSNFDELSTKINDSLYNIYLKDKTGFGTWCNEKSCVADTKSGKKFFYLERAASGFLGVKTIGAHLNGYKIKNGNLKLIIAKRSSLINSYPGLLDSMVSGFVPMNCIPEEQIVKEAYEEAGLNKTIVDEIKFVSFVNFVEVNEFFCKRGSAIIFDLCLSQSFSPKNNDGEVSEFTSLNLNEVSDLTNLPDKFKFDSRLVAIDFLLRKGFFKINNEKDFDKLSILRQNIDDLGN